MSKGTKEKGAAHPNDGTQCRSVSTDEPIAGVDPATRDYILRTIITTNPEAVVIISTHLIADVESVSTM